MASSCRYLVAPSRSPNSSLLYAEVQLHPGNTVYELAVPEGSTLLDVPASFEELQAFETPFSRLSACTGRSYNRLDPLEEIPTGPPVRKRPVALQEGSLRIELDERKEGSWYESYMASDAPKDPDTGYSGYDYPIYPALGEFVVCFALLVPLRGGKAWVPPLPDGLNKCSLWTIGAKKMSGMVNLGESNVEAYSKLRERLRNKSRQSFKAGTPPSVVLQGYFPSECEAWKKADHLRYVRMSSSNLTVPFEV